MFLLPHANSSYFEPSHHHVSFVTSHHLSDQSLVICDLKLGLTKIVAPTRMARKIMAIDRADFVRRLRAFVVVHRPC